MTCLDADDRIGLWVERRVAPEDFDGDRICLDAAASADEGLLDDDLVADLLVAALTAPSNELPPPGEGGLGLEIGIFQGDEGDFRQPRGVRSPGLLVAP